MVAMTGTVSVIIPAYNRAHCLPRAIDSALGQTHADVEVVVVDDGSTDGTRDLIARRYGSNPRVRYHWQENAGVVAARNTAIACSTGEYVAFLDSDDAWQPWKLELQLAALHAFPQAGMVWSDLEAIDPTGAVAFPKYLRRMYSAYRWFPKLSDLFTDTVSLDRGEWMADVGSVTAYVGEVYSQMIMGNLVHTSTALLRRERLALVGGFDPACRFSGEDFDFHLRTCREGPVAFLDVSTTLYQIGMPDQLSRQSTAIAVNFLKTVTKALERDRQRITLPPWMIEATLADAHLWVAERVHGDGDLAAACRHYLLSLRHRPWQPRAFAQLALCCLPDVMSAAVRAVYRRVKRAPSA